MTHQEDHERLSLSRNVRVMQARMLHHWEDFHGQPVNRDDPWAFSRIEALHDEAHDVPAPASPED